GPHLRNRPPFEYVQAGRGRQACSAPHGCGEDGQGSELLGAPGDDRQRTGGPGVVGLKTTVIAQSGQKYELYLSEYPKVHKRTRWYWEVCEAGEFSPLASGLTRFRYRARSKMIGALLDAEWEHQRKGR